MGGGGRLGLITADNARTHTLTHGLPAPSATRTLTSGARCDCAQYAASALQHATGTPLGPNRSVYCLPAADFKDLPDNFRIEAHPAAPEPITEITVCRIPRRFSRRRRCVAAAGVPRIRGGFRFIKIVSGTDLGS